MAKRMLIDALHQEETRVVIADDKQIYDFDFVSAGKPQRKGNIYLAKITRVEPSLQAAFVEYGGGKQGFLPFAEIHSDYYQIPVSDRKRLNEEVAGEEDAAEPQEAGDRSTAPAVLPDGSPDAPFVDTLPPVEQDEKEAHPAYLMEGAIDVSTSSEEIPEHVAEEIPLQEPPRMEEPFAEAPAEPSEGAPARPASEGAAPTEPSEVETLPSEEEEVQGRAKRRTFFKRYKIQEVIRRGQIVLVQAIKEERGNKGVSLTTYLSLAGRYCVLMPNSPKDGGISRKIASADDRKRLKAISTELRLAKGMSVIIRTAGMDRTRAEIRRDYDYLVKVWNGVRETTLESTAPALIYEESDLIKRSIRDQYTNDIDELIVQGDEGYKAAKEFMKLLLPSHTPRIKHYKEATPLLYAYNIEDQLLSMHDPIVKLRSGGYIVINPTEALISIDVNSGRSTGERNIEETATKTNLEATAEVARQLRLRDLAGLIVIDFIDMMESRNRRAVEKALKDALKLDRAKIQLGRISPFGLLEMSRQRLRPSISETNMIQCPHCEGRGYIRSNESMSIQIIRSLEKEAATGSWGVLRLITPQEVGLHLLNTKRNILRSIEERYSITVQVTIDNELAASEYNLEKMRRSSSGERDPDRDRDRDRGRDRGRDRDRDRDRNRRPEPRQAEIAEPQESVAQPAESESAEASPRESSEDSRRRGRRGRRGRGGRGRRDERPRNESIEATVEPAGAAAETPAEEAPAITGDTPSSESGTRPPRQRGRRGGRRHWRDRDGQGGEPPQDNRGGNRPPREQGERAPAKTPEMAIVASVPIPPPAQPSRPRQEPAAPAPAKIESTPRDPNAPVKKGWWQKMIELDE